MPETEDVVSWARLVPEVQYDLIARIPPGLFVLLCLGAATGVFHVDVEGFKGSQWAPATILFLVLLGASYVVGLMLEPAAEQVRRTYGSERWKHQTCLNIPVLSEIRDELQLPLPKTLDEATIQAFSRETILAVNAPLHEYLKRKDPQTGLVLPKLAAEVRCLDSIVAASIFLLLVIGVWQLGKLHWLQWPLPTPPRWPYDILLLAIAVSAWVAARFRYERFTTRHYSCFTATRASKARGTGAA